MTRNASNAAVSVVIPTRNRLEPLSQAIASVLAQRAVEVELIIVDEGSSDATPAFLGTLARSDNRVTVIRHHTPRGLPTARNAGLAVAVHPWIAFLDDDDVWHPDALAALSSAAVAAGKQWAFGDAVHFDDRLRPFFITSGEGAEARLRKANSVPGGGSAVLCDRETLRGLGGFDESLIAAEDWECWIRLSAVSSPAYVPLLTVAYRVARSSMSHDVARMRRAHDQVAARHPGIGGDAENRTLQRYMALQMARGGNRRGSARLLTGNGSTWRDRLLYTWVMLTGRPWQRPVRLRDRRTRGRLADAERWLATIDAEAARLRVKLGAIS